MVPDNPTLKMIREFVAIGRAGFDRPYTLQGDPDAQQKLVAGIEVHDDQGVRLNVSGPLVEILAPRAPFFDEHVLSAIKLGMEQIVNIGAGYDDRALRFRHANVRFFEVDLPHVVDDKARRLELIDDGRLAPTLIPADLSITEIAGPLIAAGFNMDKPTLFICEHVVLFLERQDVSRLVAGLASIASTGSTLALSVEVHPEDLDMDLVVSTINNLMFPHDELIRCVRSCKDWIASLRKVGWIVDTATQELAVDHFALAIAGQTVQIRTQFMTAATERSGRHAM